MQGKIIKGIAGFYYVYGEDEVLYECKAKGIFRKDNQKPLVGDNVEITILDQQEQTGNLIRILPRKNSLIRPAVANVDQAFVIFALENPKPNFMLLDRFLIMMEQAEVQMETGEISRKLKRGRHTTRHSQVIPVGEDTFLMDTPGFSSLYLMNMEEQDLKNYFPEFRKYEDTCRFQGCRHIHEPGCRVKEALENGEISRLRYEDYLSLYEELKEKRRY